MSIEDNCPEFYGVQPYITNRPSPIPNTDYNFVRQDSLAECINLQQRDRDNNMNSFMEDEIDITEYIGTTGINLAITANDYDMRYEDDLVKEPWDSYLDCSRRNSTSYSPSVDGLSLQIKQEPIHDLDEEKPTPHVEVPPTTRSRRPRSQRDPSNDLFAFVPNYKARKYTMKAEDEKATAAYKLKRLRNNDAVRKSRTKQKNEQERCNNERTELLEKNASLESENIRLRADVERLCSVIKQKESQIEILRTSLLK